MMLFFGQRKVLAEAYKKWIKENDIIDCPESVIAFLTAEDLMNVENVVRFVERRC